MKYKMVLDIHDRNGVLLKSVLLNVLDIERDFTCDVGYAFGPSEAHLLPRIADISIRITEHDSAT